MSLPRHDDRVAWSTLRNRSDDSLELRPDSEYYRGVHGAANLRGAAFLSDWRKADDR